MELINISGSRTRRWLLRLFFTNPERSYYVRQLERITSTPASNIHRELKQLSSEGVLKSRSLGNIVLYQPDTDYYIYNELRSIIRKTRGAEGMVRRQFRKLAGIHYVCLYADFATQTETDQSSVAVFYIGKPDPAELQRIIKKIEVRLERTLEVVGMPGWDNDTRAAFAMLGPHITVIGSEPKQEEV